MAFFVPAGTVENSPPIHRWEALEVPGDYDGVVYTPFDDHGGWKQKLVKELKAAGYNVDANAL